MCVELSEVVRRDPVLLVEAASHAVHVVPCEDFGVDGKAQDVTDELVLLVL